MKTELRDRAEALFLELVELPAESWPALLEARCGGDVELKEDVASLLGCHHDAGSFLDRQELLALTPDLVRTSEPPLPEGTRIGEYTLERVIGAGGMGVVYQARQERPRRVVALKLVNSAIASRALVRRFEHEAEMLGRLQHPGIAQIFEAGAADAGEGSPRRPFISMELVDGPSLLEYAKRRGLSTRERIELLIRVCDAVQHAHQRGVIHRDLKPANILVDPTGQPKILDFGVARAVSADLQMTTQHTSVGQLIGTLPYMSPEQVLGQPNEIDTRTDVYALGVILFEMLTGRQPLELGNRSIPDAVAMIRNQDPARLSSISRVYRGDLEVIVGTALEKDRSRRYQSAAELSADLAHFLAGEPITAKVDSAFYVLKKQIRRHRGAVAVGLAALLGLLAFAVYASVQSHRNGVLAANERAARLEADAARDQARRNAEQLRWNLYVSAIGFAQAAQSANDMARLKRVLDSCPEDLRGWEWHYLRHSSDTASRVQPLDDGRTSFAASPDGTRLLRFLHEAPVLLLDSADARVLREIDLGGEQLTTGCISPDNRTALFGSTIGGIFVVDLESGSFRRVASPVPFPVHPLAAWPDGRRAMMVFQTSPETLQAFAVDLSDGHILWEVERHSQHMSAAISPDGRAVGVGDVEGRVVVMDEEGCLIREPIMTRGWVRALRFSPDGSRLAFGGNEGAVYVLDLANGSTARHQLFENKIWSIAWSPDSNHLAAAGTEGYIRVIDSWTGRAVSSHFGHDSTIHTLAWPPTGRRLFSAAHDMTMRWWASPEQPVRPTVDVQEGIQTGCWAADGQSFYLGLDSGRVVEVDARTMEVRREVFRLASLVNFIRRSHDGRLLALVGNDGTVVMLEAATLSEVSRFKSPTLRALGVSFSPDDSRVALSGDHHSVTIWDPMTGRMLNEFAPEATAATRAEYSPDGRVIAAAYYDSIIRIHDANTGEVLRVLKGQTDWSNHPRFTPDGRTLVASCADSRIYVWNLESEAPPRVLIGHQNAVFGGSLSADGKRYVSGGWDNTIRLWDVESGLELLMWRPHINANWVAEFSPDGSRFFTASKDGTAILWTYEPRQ
ncbi:MAG: protein kinase [Phycisphaerae bacterium]|nr:protein kinase [Phycisphaerae bacterium]